MAKRWLRWLGLNDLCPYSGARSSSGAKSTLTWTFPRPSCGSTSGSSSWLSTTAWPREGPRYRSPHSPSLPVWNLNKTLTYKPSKQHKQKQCRILSGKFPEIFSFCHLNSLKSSPSGQTSNGVSIAEETLSSCHFWRRGNIKNNDYVSRDTFCHNKIFFFHSFPLLHFLLPILWSWKLFEELKFLNEWNVVFSILFFFWAKSSS